MSRSQGPVGISGPTNANTMKRVHVFEINCIAGKHHFCRVGSSGRFLCCGCEIPDRILDRFTERLLGKNSEK